MPLLNHQLKYLLTHVCIPSSGLNWVLSSTGYCHQFKKVVVCIARTHARTRARSHMHAISGKNVPFKQQYRFTWLKDNLTFSFLECPHIPVTEGLIRKGNMNSLGSKVILDCEEGFTSSYYVDEPLPVTIECRSNGSHPSWRVQPFWCVPGNRLVFF